SLNGTISGWNFEYNNQGISGKPAANVPALCAANVFGCVVPANDFSQFMYVYNTPVTNTDGSKGGLVDPYITLATQYGWANYMFQTIQGPSFPAHQFIFGATSAPSATDDAMGIFASENMGCIGCSKTTVLGAGCIANPNVTVKLINSAGSETALSPIFPCFEHQTLSDLIEKQPSLDWEYYAAGQSTIWTAPDAISHICGASSGQCAAKDFVQHVDVANPSDVLTAIGGCSLTSVTWITP